MNAPQPLQLPTHEEIEDARAEAMLDAKAEREDQPRLYDDESR